MNLDQFVVVYLNQMGVGMTSIVVFFAEYFPYLIAALFLVFVLIQRKHPLGVSPSSAKGGSALGGKEGERLKIFLEGVVAVFLSRGVFVELIRYFYHRPRPFVEDSAIVALLHETSYSFPSGHAAFFFALATTVYLHNKRWGIWFFIASAVISLARIMAGVHYLTDIVGGGVLGVVAGWTVHRLLRKDNPLSVFHLEKGER